MKLIATLALTAFVASVLLSFALPARAQFSDLARVQGVVWNDANGNSQPDAGENLDHRVKLELWFVGVDGVANYTAGQDTFITEWYANQSNGTYYFENGTSGYAYYVKAVVSGVGSTTGGTAVNGGTASATFTMPQRGQPITINFGLQAIQFDEFVHLPMLRR